MGSKTKNIPVHFQAIVFLASFASTYYFFCQHLFGPPRYQINDMLSCTETSPLFH